MTTKSSPRLFLEWRSRERIEVLLQCLDIELAAGTARRHLDRLVELCELLVEQTGGNFATAALRREIATAKQRVEARPLSLVVPEVAP